MIAPGLPNPFDYDRPGRQPAPAADPARAALDAAIAAALRAEPLAAAPPLLYAAVMRGVRQEPRPAFRISWLDIALSLFAAGMLLAVWWALASLPDVWLDYARLLAVYQLQKVWYLNFPLLAWSSAAAAVLLACLAFTALIRGRI